MAGPHPRDYFNNWSRSDLSLREKLTMATRNTAIKLKNQSACCGNHGEPGC
jgi:hypothetical protein